MLQLPVNWPFMPQRSIARKLLSQLPTSASRGLFVRCYFWALLDVANDVRAEKGDPRVEVKEEPDFTWHEDDTVYHLVIHADRNWTPPISAAANSDLLIITAPRNRRRISAIVQHAMPGGRVGVLSAAGFMNVRLFFTTLASRWSNAELCRRLFDAYNERATTLKLPNLRVMLPWTAT